MDGPEDWAVRADRLQAAGDPWGQRIALWMARASATHKREHRLLRDALAELEAAHGEHFFGPELLALLANKGFPARQLGWECGYIVRARIMAPKQGFAGLAMADIVQALVRSPAAEFLGHLAVGLLDFESHGLRAAVAAASAGRPLGALAGLFLGSDGRNPGWMACAALGDLSPLWPITPQLRTLRLRGCDIELGRFEHRSLQRLEIETTGLPAASVRSLALAKLPELRHMKVWLGLPTYAAIDTIDDLMPLFESTTLPKLEQLGLQKSTIHDDIAIALADSKLLEQLRKVDLQDGGMSERGARALLDNARRFHHLDLLDLRKNPNLGGLVQQLRAAIPSVRVDDEQIRSAAGFQIISHIEVSRKQ